MSPKEVSGSVYISNISRTWSAAMGSATIFFVRINFVEQTTGLQNFGQYLTSMLEIDAFFLNEDRHTNNIAVQYNAADDTYALCPLFDNGLSLLADTNMDFLLERSLEDCLKAV